MKQRDEMDVRQLERDIPDFYHVHVFDCLESTNTWLMGHTDLPEGTVVIADAQSKGRGRAGHSFYSPGGTGLYLSLLLKPERNMEVSLLSTAAAAAACAQAVEEIYGVSCSIKWLNDVFCGGKKIAGILCEARLQAGGDMPQAVVLGIGINVHPCRMPEDLKELAGSVEAFAGTEKPRRILAARFLNIFLKYYLALDQRTFLNAYRSRSAVIGRRVTVMTGSGSYRAAAIGIDDACRLIVRLDCGEIRYLSSGEISIRL